MVLMTHQIRGCSCTFPLTPLSWNKVLKLRQHLTTLHMIGRKDRCFLVKRNLQFRGACVRGSKARLLKISAFQGSEQSDESRGRINGSKDTKKSVKVSYVPKESGETIIESAKAHSVPVPCTSEGNEGISGSPAIHKLFKRWLNMLRSTSPNPIVGDIIEEGSSPVAEVQEAQPVAQPKERDNILKVICSYVLGLDAAIMIPLVTFVPFFMAVKVMYGAKVSKELTPLWILGSLIVALYVKVLQGVWALYVFSYRQTVKVIKFLPVLYAVVHNTISQQFQLVEEIKVMGYKEFSRKKMEEFREWSGERYIDFQEVIWPLYYRVLISLKRANFID